MKQMIPRRDRARTLWMKPITIDAIALADELRGTVRGEVRFDEGSRALYATDSSNYRQVPIGVVLPRDGEDVIATVAACRRSGAPLLARGGGTSLAGQCCNVALVLDLSKYMNSIIEIDPDNKLARVQPGTNLDHLRTTAERSHLTFGPDPATHAQCTLGGMIGNNSCGVHSVMAGMTSDNIEELEILTYEGLRMHVGRTSDEELARIIEEGGRRGEIYASLKALRDNYADLIRTRYPKIPRRVSGYNLDQLLPENGFHVARALVGTEGTCVTELEATTRLVYSPPARSLLVLGYADGYRAADHVMEVLAHGPIGLEGFDSHLIENMRRKHLQPENIVLLPEGGGWLLVEFGGENQQEAEDRARGLMEELKRKGDPPTMKLFTNLEEARRVWLVREAPLGAEEAVLKKLGLDFEILDAGCCGMAGIFGFEIAHYDVSIKCGERVLLPAVRLAASDTLIIADGFSCQEQIAQTTDRRALHLAQVIQMAMHDGGSGPAEEYPEVGYVTQAAHPSRLRLPVALGMSTGLLLISAVITWMWRKRKMK